MAARAPRRVDAVIFDMDGTLIDSSGTVPAAYAAAIRELCGRRYSDEDVIAEYGAGPAAALIGRFIGRKATEGDVDCWLRHLEARLDMTVIYPGTVAAIERLAAAGLQLGVFTGATRRAAQLQLQHSGLLEAFSAVVGSDEIAAVKPAPDGILEACRRLDVDPTRAAYVGDAINDLRCARAARSIPIAAAWGHLYERGIEAHLVAGTPDELVDMLLSDTAGMEPPGRGH
jgi:phosphoglycolate phosphatase-like HAD superfamily hydrolase